MAESTTFQSPLVKLVTIWLWKTIICELYLQQVTWECCDIVLFLGYIYYRWLHRTSAAPKELERLDLTYSTPYSRALTYPTSLDQDNLPRLLSVSLHNSHALRILSGSRCVSLPLWFRLAHCQVSAFYSNRNSQPYSEYNSLQCFCLQKVCVKIILLHNISLAGELGIISWLCPVSQT